jgi:DNA-binding CsgD family transcriptional regulator
VILVAIYRYAPTPGSAPSGNNLQESLSVYSGREEGFSDRERAGLETLGSVAGFAVRATRQEDLLVADTATEVTLAVRDETVPFVRAAREANCRLSLDGAVPRGDGAVVCYLGADESGEESPSDDPVEKPGESDETAAERLDGVLTETTDVDDVRWIRRDQAPLVQATVTGDTPVTALVGWGATVRTAEYAPGSARFVAEVPPDGDVRRLVEAVDATVTETDLAAREETVRNTESVEAFRDGLDERLTERQRTVLRTAYLSEYFASPRGSTSAEVAETLDIAGSTMLHHLRRAERKLVDAFFESERERPSSDGP